MLSSVLLSLALALAASASETVGTRLLRAEASDITSLFEGNKRFQATTDLELLAKLADEGQSPSSVYIGCVDSRVPESLIMNAPPGTLFTTRSIANRASDLVRRLRRDRFAAPCSSHLTRAEVSMADLATISTVAVRRRSHRCADRAVRRLRAEGPQRHGRRPPRMRRRCVCSDILV